MTPSILKELFDTWRKENRSFCITSDNFNKSNALIESQRGGGQILSFKYPFHDALASKDHWIEKHNFEGEIPEYLSKDLIDEISAWLNKSYKPANISLRLTTYCNYYCPMCPYHGDSEFVRNYYKESPSLKQVHMPLDKAKRIVDEIFDHGIKDLNLSAEGEFFLYPYWEEFLRYTTQKGISSTLTTNGSLITQEFAKKLSQFKITEMGVSVDTLNFETFKKLRSDKEKFFHNTINAPILLHEAGIYTQVNFVRQRINNHEFDDVLDRYKGCVDQICTLDEVPYQEMSYKAGVNNRPYPLSLCEGFGEYIIQPDGNVSPCCYIAIHPHLLREKGLNVFSKSLTECLDGLKSSFLNEQLDGHCMTCPYYRSRMIDKASMKIYKGYFVIHNYMLTRYFKIPDKLASLDDKILLFMYQNHIVTQMKQAAIL